LALRIEYRTALAQAQADIPVFGDIGPGWAAAFTVADVSSAQIKAYGGTDAFTSAAATTALAQEQVRLYGSNRYQQMSRLDTAMQSVRDQYAQALLRAQAHGSSPSWIDRPLELTSFSQPDSYDDGGIAMSSPASRAMWAPFERVFDADIFTAWYVQQPVLANQAFANFYGISRTVQVSEANIEFGGPAVTRMAFDNPHWTLDWSVGGSGLGNSSASLTHKELAHLNLNDPPNVHHDEAVGSDFDAGWSNAQANVARDADGLETVAEVAFIVGVGIATSGAMGSAGFGGTEAPEGRWAARTQRTCLAVAQPRPSKANPRLAGLYVTLS
jgi:hypothetical protein